MILHAKVIAVGGFLVLCSNEIGAFDPGEFLVKGLEDIEPAFASFKGRMFAGLLPFHLQKEKKGEFMFWLFEPEEPTDPDTLSIYITGGPGCSSIGTGNVFGSGPVTVPKFPAGTVDPADKDDPFVPNPNSWVVATNVLYIEQPATTGFSYGPLPMDEDDVSRDVYNFLINFFETFQDMKSKDIYIWGGSYSGMMVPAIARKIYHENKKCKEDRKMNLVGIALGNAWLDPDIQAPAAVEFAWGHGLIDMTTKNIFLDAWKDCRQGLSVPFQAMHPFNMPDECGLDEIVLQAAGEGLFEDMAPNCYDITTWDPYNVLGNDGTINKFYNNPLVQKALHAPPTKWYGCVDNKDLLKYDKPQSVVPYIAELLDEAGLRVLFYNGDRDLLCCHTGTDMMLNSMRWSNASEWKHASRGLWMVDNRVAGYTKSVGNLEFLVVYNSGHMVTHNQPIRSLDMVKRFLKDKTLLDVELPSYHQHQGKGKEIVSEDHGGKPRLIGFAAILFICALLSVYLYKYSNITNKRQDYDELCTDNKVVTSSTDNSDESSKDSKTNEMVF